MPPNWGRPPTPPRNPLLGCALGLSLLLNIAAAFVVVIACLGLTLKTGNLAAPPPPLLEEHVRGDRASANKVAVLHLDGVILEGALSHFHRQVDQAARDKTVKACVVRINSPGGSITSSEDLHRRLTKLRDGDPDKKTEPRPLVASMGPIAASGGYYVAMAAETVYAERSTLTGSIGVYIAFPNVEGLGKKYGFRVEVIKAGAIKDSGSFFKEMTPEERQVWQDMVDDAYLQFLSVVEKGRPALKGKLLDRFSVTPLRPDPRAKAEKATPYVRYRADGGTFTAPQAKKFQLIDEIGTLEDAIAAAAKKAELGDSYRAIKYQRPKTLANLLLGARAQESAGNGNPLEPARLRAALAPRLWYLAPGYQAAGLLAAAEADQPR